MADDPRSRPETPLVVCIAGSPRRHGNSEQMLDACIRGIEAAGGVAERIAVVEYGIKPCQGCNACSLTGECVVRDRMREIYPRLDAADAIVVASPVYFATVPAVLKALYDRCQPYWARIHVLKEPPAGPKRPGALLLVRGGGDSFGFQAAVYTTKSVFAVLGVECVEQVKVEGPDSPSDIGRHPDALMRAEEVGRSIVARVRGVGG
ncbi:MAG: flavodoxin family protein [Coriobacteriia bacterium]|nr:flavodoxin family protein [Coriobacteriia bacterium]